MFDGKLIFLLVFFGNFSPVAVDMSVEKFGRELLCPL
jgi:hypothetical protein